MVTNERYRTGGRTRMLPFASSARRDEACAGQGRACYVGAVERAPGVGYCLGGIRPLLSCV